MKQLLADVLKRSEAYIEQRNERHVGPRTEDVEALAGFRHPLPERGIDPACIIDQLDTLGSPATVCASGPRYFGFVTGGTLPAALAANWLSTVWDQNAAMHIMSPVASVLEEIALDWIRDALHLPPESGACFTTGATMANFTALAAARHSVLRNAGWDVEAQGLFGAPEIQVILGGEVHVSLLKSLAMLGLGRDRAIRVPVDGQGRMLAKALPEIQAPAIVCLQAGNVNSGAFDPAADILRKVDGRAWVHVDGAFGLWALASPNLCELARGFELADSWATDGHKWLNVSYDCGIAFVRDRHALKDAMAAPAPYLTASSQRDGMDFSPESSRRARGIEVWAALLSLGREGLAAMIERCVQLARRFARRLADGGCEVLNDVVLNQVVVSFGSEERTREVILRVQQQGECWCGATRWRGRFAMRISVSSWATTDADVDRSVRAILNCADGIELQYRGR
jgi:glutamate/tyrosine decarboxylase-like PLP-dependent enzyme